MQRSLLFVLAICTLFAILLVLPLHFGAWLPDVFSGKERVLASANSRATGYTFQVVQHWGFDFYTTELRVRAADGRTVNYLLDGDDSKSWKVPLTVNETDHEVVVVLSGNRPRSITFDELRAAFRSGRTQGLLESRL